MLFNGKLSGADFSEFLDKKKIEMKPLIEKYFDKHFKLNLSPSNEFHHIKQLSWLIAISMLYRRPDEILWGKALYDEATDVYYTLTNEVMQKLYHPIKWKVLGKIPGSLDLLPHEKEKIIFMLNEEGAKGNDSNPYRNIFPNQLGIEDFSILRNDLTVKLIKGRNKMAVNLAADPVARADLIHCTKRPSLSGQDKSKIIRQELEAIIIDGTLTNNINRNTLWIALLDRAKNNPKSGLTLSSRNTVKEKETSTEWTLDRARSHLDKVSKWHAESLVG